MTDRAPDFKKYDNCYQCGQPVTGPRDAVAVVFRPEPGLVIHVTGFYHTGACADQAHRLFGLAFAAGVNYEKREQSRQRRR